MKTILASASPTRRQIFENLGIKFEVIPSDFDEKIPKKLNDTPRAKRLNSGIYPRESGNLSQISNLVQYLAEEKAKSVYKKIEQEKDIIVLGFDSLVELNGEIIGKLKTQKEALETFQKFRGQKVGLYTGISIIGKFRGKFFQKTSYELSHLYFKQEITNCQLRDFLSYKQWQNVAGGIRVEGATQFLLEKIDGDWLNIIGVPVLKMNEMILKTLGKPAIKIFEKNNSVKFT